MSNTTDPTDFCTAVSSVCPVEATTYGYRPNLAGNIILLVIFAACALAQAIMAFVYRLPSFGTVVTIGCVGEAIGYIGRIIMHSNPWSDAGFKTQVVCLIIAPSFLAAGIYLTLKHIVMALGPEMSRLKPKLYTWIFISADAFSILLQAVGGGLASSGDSVQDAGNNLMIAGVAVQVATMAVCVLLAADFGWTLLRSKSISNKGGFGEVGGANYARTTAFRFYLGCSAMAFLTIFIRCIYRLPEMAGGWGNTLMRKEADFMVLDGAMIAIACILLTVAHPGIFFPDMRTRKARSSPVAMPASSSVSELQEQKPMGWDRA